MFSLIDNNKLNAVSPIPSPLCDTIRQLNASLAPDSHTDISPTQQLETDALTAMSNIESANTIDLTTENSFVMGKSNNKEAMTHSKSNEKVPESFNIERQKMQMHTSSDTGLGIGFDQTPNEETSNSSRELYLSKFDTSITTNHIANYLNNKGVLQNKVRIIRLSKKNQDLGALSFVSFKLETSTEIANTLCTPGFWPHNCRVKDFVRKRTNAQLPIAAINDTSNEDFHLLPRPQQRPSSHLRIDIL